MATLSLTSDITFPFEEHWTTDKTVEQTVFGLSACFRTSVNKISYQELLVYFNIWNTIFLLKVSHCLKGGLKPLNPITF